MKRTVFSLQAANSAKIAEYLSAALDDLAARLRLSLLGLLSGPWARTS